MFCHTVVLTRKQTRKQRDGSDPQQHLLHEKSGTLPARHTARHRKDITEQKTSVDKNSKRMANPRANSETRTEPHPFLTGGATAERQVIFSRRSCVRMDRSINSSIVNQGSSSSSFSERRACWTMTETMVTSVDSLCTKR